MHQIEKVFTVAVPVERAWAAFAESAERSRWEADVYEIDPVPGGRLRWEIPPLVAEGEVIAVEPLRLLRHVERSGPHAHHEVTVTFASVEGGTEITITQSGFGDPASGDWLEGTSLGWDEAIADLCCYLTTGVAPRRFNDGMRSPGMFMKDTPAGVKVTVVHPVGLADEAGIVAGDLLLRVHGVPVFSVSDLWVLMRQLPVGAPVEVEYVHDGAARRATGTVTTW